MQLSTLSLALTAAYGAGFSWRSLFSNNTPGFRINVEEAIRLNQQALGPELLPNTLSAAAWSTSKTEVSVSGGQVSIAYTATGSPNASQAFTTTGKVLVMRANLVGKTAPNAVQVRVGSGPGLAEYAQFTVATAGPLQWFVSAPAGTVHMTFGYGETAAGQNSVWSGISVREIDLSKCVAFQDSAGTLPVVSMEQPLGLILDTKLGVPVRGVESLTNGDFSLGASNWTVTGTDATHIATFSGGSLRYQSDTTSPALLLTQAGALVVGKTYEVVTNVSAYISGALKSDSFGGVTLASRAGENRVIATSTTTVFGFTRSTTNVDLTVDSISVRELPGVHFVQPSNTASRPIVSRRVNLLVGTTTLATQSVTTLAASHVLTFTGTGSVTLSGTATGTYSAGTHTITTTAGTLTVTVFGSVTNADLRLSSDVPGIPSYQRVTSSTDYDEVGFPAYARCDGLDDWLESGVVDMSSTDAVTVIAGVKKRSDAATAIVLESSPTLSSNNGTFLVGAPTLSGSSKYTFSSKGTVEAAAGTTSTAFSAPHKALLTGIGRISTDTAILRVNGVPAASSSVDQGTGNYGAHKFYMGMRAGSSLPFNGRIYGVTVIGRLLSTQELLAAETAERQLGSLY